MESEKRPLIGVGTIVLKDGKVLLGKRKNSHGDGTWQFPGGHLEFNETIEECSRREVFEETGIKIKNLRIGPYTNDRFIKENKHYVTLYVIADYEEGNVCLKEPDKCDAWEWFDWQNLPAPKFLPLENLLKSGFCPE